MLSFGILPFHWNQKLCVEVHNTEVCIACEQNKTKKNTEQQEKMDIIFQRRNSGEEKKTVMRFIHEPTMKNQNDLYSKPLLLRTPTQMDANTA